MTTQRIQPLQPTVQHPACCPTSASHPLMCSLRIRILKHTAWATRLFWLTPGGVSSAHKLLIIFPPVHPCTLRISHFYTSVNASLNKRARQQRPKVVSESDKSGFFLMRHREFSWRSTDNRCRIYLKQCGHGHKFFPLASNCGHTHPRARMLWMPGQQDAPDGMTVLISTRVLP